MFSSKLKDADKDKYVAMAIIVVTLSFGLWFYINIKNQDINFSQRVFAGLIKGRHSVQKMIDWANLEAVDVNVGQTYSSLPNNKERTDYRQAFIDNFSLGFRKAGGSFKSFTNWRIYDNSSDTVIIAADYKDKGKTILFTISKYEQRKLQAIQWGNADVHI